MPFGAFQLPGRNRFGSQFFYFGNDDVQNTVNVFRLRRGGNSDEPNVGFVNDAGAYVINQRAFDARFRVQARNLFAAQNLQRQIFGLAFIMRMSGQQVETEFKLDFAFFRSDMAKTADVPLRQANRLLPAGKLSEIFFSQPYQLFVFKVSGRRQNQIFAAVTALPPVVQFGLTDFAERFPAAENVASQRLAAVNQLRKGVVETVVAVVLVFVHFLKDNLTFAVDVGLGESRVEQNVGQQFNGGFTVFVQHFD